MIAVECKFVNTVINLNSFLNFRFTTWRAFRDMLKEITDLAGQRERVAETFEEQIIHGILILAKTLKDERKVC